MYDSRPPTVAIATLGCKVNQADSDAFAQRFTEAGFLVVPEDEPADVCIINSCSVTNVGDQKSRQLIQRSRRHNPDALLAVTGCYAAIAPANVERITGADLVAGLADKERLLDLVQERLVERGCELPAPLPAGRIIQAAPRTRLNVKVQDGCNDFCTYCIVPLTRGRARSVPVEDVVRQVRRAEAEGFQEVVLTGVNMTAYGRELKTTFGRLLETVLRETSIRRIRLSSVEPFKFDRAWLRLWENPRLCRHLHLPLQSGCDETLRRMHRRYDAGWYASLVDDIRAAVPDIAIWTDVIAGFPGESDEEFERSFAFIEKMEFAGVHVFRYSRRTGTRAATMADQVPDGVRKERSARLLRLSQAGKRRFAAAMVGSRAEVLFEEDGTGLTGNYVRVQAEGGAPNSFAQVKLFGLSSDGLNGVIERG